MGCLNHWSQMRGPWWGALSLLLLVSLVATAPQTTWAQEAEVVEEEAAVVEEAAEPAAEAPAAETVAEEETQSTTEDAVESEAAAPAAEPTAPALIAANTSWMLTSSALVLFMTAPGLAMFYGGLVRKKNVLGVMMQCVFLMGLMTVIWSLYGYSLAFGDLDAKSKLKPYIGGSQYVMMNEVARSWDEEAGAPVEHMWPDPVSGWLPLPAHMLFQGMFFIITPALICGAFAERMKFSSMVVFSVLWGTIVYCPLCHWVWDAGILGFATTDSIKDGSAVAWSGGALDFAGGTVVHISSGVSALICALVIGKRKGFGHDDMRPHNLTYTVLGAAMLWVGWFGFNAGSELASDHLATSAFATTHFSAAAGLLGWVLYEWLTHGKPTVLGAASGLVAGLVCITPGAGFVNLMPALAMGFAAGIVCAFACSKVKGAFGYDDSLDAFGVHGIGGTLGAILTGVFATRAAWNIDNGNKLGLIEGESRVFIGQIVAVVVTWVFSIVATFIILKVIDAVMGLRVSEQGEVIGLDQSQHGEEGYIFT
ncbi:ammonium transporter [Lacipirellula parvula]|uniref:Ammonium transporter n=1 Tax=Lacipirellula parvula TaxID=2650471 RepID=A0A5K7XC82_9BACT|nr:ammonium transporter [Lacipirellula parvula]BBO33965.1 ammonium transporter [Lacipirellula parvula]